MASILRDWVKSPHLRPIAYLASGSAIAQVIGVVATPIVTRLYEPSDYGVAALYGSIVVIVATVAALRYESAIPLPPETSEGERDAIALVRVSLLAAAVVSALVLVTTLVVVASGRFQAISDMGNWVYAIPLGILVSSWSLTLNAYAIRGRRYSAIARIAPLQKVASVSLQIGGGLLRLGKSGLMIAAVATPLVGLGVLSRVYRAGRAAAAEPRDDARPRMRKVAIRYRDFPLVSTWFALLNALAWNIQVVVIAHYYTTAEVGQYALAFAMISLPMGLVLAGVSQVYNRECAARASDTEAVLRLARKTLRSLTAVSVPLFSGLYLASTYLFGIIFGQNWLQAGAIAAAMIPLLWARFLTTSLTTTFNVYRRQGVLLAWQVLALSATLSAFVWGGEHGLDVTQITWLSSALTAPVYLLLIPMVFWVISQGPPIQTAEEVTPSRSEPG